MPWSGSAPNQTFSRGNGVNSGATTWAQDEAAAVGITTARHDVHDEDIADSLNLTLKKDGGNKPTADIDWGGFKVTNLADATAATGAATLGQVQTTIRNRSVRVATTANITIATALNNGDTLDGITLATDDLVLVKDQSAPEENGVFRVAASPARDTDWDAWNDYPGALITVHEGTANADKAFLCTANRGGTLGSTSLTFSAFTSASQASESAAGIGEWATAAEFRSNTADRELVTDRVWSAAAEVTLTDAATIAVDMSTFINAIVTLGDNRTLGQPSNTKVGQSGVIRIVQDGTGSRTLAYHADWKFAGGVDPVLTTTASATDLLYYQVIATNFIHASLVKGLA